MLAAGESLDEFHVHLILKRHASSVMLKRSTRFGKVDDEIHGVGTDAWVPGGDNLNMSSKEGWEYAIVL